MKTYKEFCSQINITEQWWNPQLPSTQSITNKIYNTLRGTTPQPPERKVLAYKNYQSGVLNKTTGQFTARPHTSPEAQRYGWKPGKSSVYVPGDRFTPNNITATGEPHTSTSPSVAVPFKYAKGQAPSGSEGKPSTPYGTKVSFTRAPMGTNTRSVNAKVNDVGDFGKTGSVNPDVTHDLGPAVVKGLGGNPKTWGKEKIYYRTNK